jgi:N,N'-diacetyllegionaminate synthase
VQDILIDGKPVGPGKPCYLIAEAGVNHNGDLDRALTMVDVAAAAGADAVKFQVIHADGMVTRDAPMAAYQRRNLGGAAQTQYDMLKKLELPREAYGALQRRCRRRGVAFLATPFDAEGADLLAELEMPAFKISSGDLNNPALLAHVGAFGKPVILSTGMGTWDEVEAALGMLRHAGTAEIVLLHCVSSYPTELEDANLRAMQTLQKRFGLPVGFSDHTRGIELTPAVVASGACVIEKHFTLDHTLPGPDHAASIEPADLARLVRTCRTVERALGSGNKEPAVCELAVARVARRSLTAARSIPVGTILCPDDIVLKRPGTGLAPSMLESLVGCQAAMDIPAGVQFSAGMFVAEPRRLADGPGERCAA